MNGKEVRFCGFLSKLGIIVSDCLFSSSKKGNALVSIQVQLPVGTSLSQYLYFTSLNRVKTFECYVEGCSCIIFLHGLLE